MESAKAKELRINYVVYTKVLKVTKEIQRVHRGGVGDQAVFEEMDFGWYVHFEGSYEALNFGPDKPRFKQNDRIKITFEKVE